MFCANCGSRLPQGESSCHQCGRQIKSSAASPAAAVSERPAAVGSLPAGVVAGIILALVVLGMGAGARVLAPTMADRDCWELQGVDQVGIRLYCAGDRDVGGWCAGLTEGSELAPAAAACAWPALAVQKVSFGEFLVFSLLAGAAASMVALLVAGGLRLRGAGGNRVTDEDSA